MFSFDHLKIGDHLSLICIEKSYVERTMMQRRENFFHCTVPDTRLSDFSLLCLHSRHQKVLQNRSPAAEIARSTFVLFHCCMNSDASTSILQGIFINLLPDSVTSTPRAFRPEAARSVLFPDFDGFTDMRLCGIQHLCCFLKLPLSTLTKNTQLFQIHNFPHLSVILLSRNMCRIPVPEQQKRNSCRNP